MDRNDYRILKILTELSGGSLSDIKNRCNFTDGFDLRFQALLDSKLIGQNQNGTGGVWGDPIYYDSYFITESGIIQFENARIAKRKESITFWIPVIISIFATTISLFALFYPKPVSEEDIRKIAQEQIEIHIEEISDAIS